MSQQYINVGAQPNDGLGDPIRTAFEKTNENFTELYANDANINLSNISTNIIPSANLTYSLGNSTRWWSNAWIGANTLYIGGVPLGVTGNTLVVDGNSVVTTSNTGNAVIGNLAVSDTTIATDTGNIFISATNSYSWQFGENGNLTTPGNIIVNGAVSATGNIQGSYILGNGAFLTGLPAGYSNSNAASFLAVFGSNTISSTGTITTTANVTGGNILTAGILSSTGNITAGNITTDGTISVGGITLNGNLIVGQGPTLTIDPNGAGGTDGNVVITGNLTVQGTTTTINSNSITTNDLQINMANNAANATSANNGGIEVGPAGAPYATLLYNTASNVWVASLGISSVGNLSTGTNLIATGNVSGGNILTNNSISAGGNVTGAYILGNGSQLTGLPAGYADSNAASFLAVFGSNTISSTGTITTTANVTGGNILTSGIITATGNITGAYILGNGSQLTGLPAGYANSNVSSFLSVYGDNTISSTGNIITTANVSGGNLVSAGNVSFGNFTIYQSGSKLYFAYNGTAVFSFDSTGTMIAANNVTAAGTP